MIRANVVNVGVDFPVMTTRRTAGPVDGAKSPAATLTTLDAQAVTIADGVWARRQAGNHDAALPHGFRMLAAAGPLPKLRTSPRPPWRPLPPAAVLGLA